MNKRYYLRPEYDARQSFYNKATVEERPDGTEILYSYETPVVKIKGNEVTLSVDWDASQTTLRHVKEFLKQNGFKALSSKQIGQDYKVVDTIVEGKTKTELKEADDENSDTKYDPRIVALAKKLDVDPATITQDKYDEDYFGVEEGDRGYLVLTSSQAYDRAEEYVEQTFDELGLDAFTPSFQDWIMSNAMDNDFFENLVHEDNESYVSDLEYENSSDEFDNRLVEELYEHGLLTDDDFEVDEDGNVDYSTLSSDVDLEDLKERYIEALDEDIDDPVEYIRDNYGDEFMRDLIKNNNCLDVSKVVDGCIEQDGVAHFIASYDGEELDLGDDLFAYRVN